MNNDIESVKQDTDISYEVLGFSSDPVNIHSPMLEKLNTINLSELFDSFYENKTALIESLVYPGLYILAGAPKLGKSFLVSQMAYHVSTGIPLWNFKTQKGTVLYLSLEDDRNRLQKRFYRMFGGEESSDLFLSESACSIENGLMKQLELFIKEHENTKLIIIDTFQKVRESGYDYSYGNDYQVMSSLKSFADQNGITLFLVHHTRKQKANDGFDMIAGTNGLLGAADGAFILRKDDRTSNYATLDVTGRDQQDLRLRLVRNPDTLVWDLESVETEPQKEPDDPVFESFVKGFKARNIRKWTGTPTDLCQLLFLNIKPNVLSTKLNVYADKLYGKYGIRYERLRQHDGRRIILEDVSSDGKE